MPDSEVIELTKELVKIQSYCGLENQETEAAEYLNSLFLLEGFESKTEEVLKGRRNVIATLKGIGGGRNLMLNGHLDTVPAYGMANPFEPEIKEGKLFGRGSVDMKGPIAAMVCAMKAIKKLNLSLKGDVMFAGVIDEETNGAGMLALVKDMPDVNAAIIGEPSNFHVCIAHRGLEWLEIHIEGKTVHGGRQREGLNAITMAAKLINSLDEYMEESIGKSSHPIIGRGSYNIGTIRGGTQPSTVAGDCVITLDRRWLPGETHKEIIDDLQDFLHSFAKDAPGYKFRMKIHDSSVIEPGYAHEAMETPKGDPIVGAVARGVTDILGVDPVYSFFPAWTDGGLLGPYGKLPIVVFGPGELESAHSDAEFINIECLVDAVAVYGWIIYQYCR